MAIAPLERNTGIHSHSANPTDTNFFNGALMHGQNSYDPYVSGYAFIKWLRIPSWIDEVFKPLSEKNFKAFGGINDVELETGGITSGFTANELHYAKGIGTKSAEFTLKYQEQSGSPLTKIYNKWVSGIRDPRTGIATYPKQYGIDYHSHNHTGSILYVVTRPDADNTGMKIIEHASIFTHVMPKKILLNHFNYESGSHENFEQEMSFSGYHHFGEEVEAYAIEQLGKIIGSSGIPFVTENQTGSILRSNLI